MRDSWGTQQLCHIKLQGSTCTNPQGCQKVCLHLNEARQCSVGWLRLQIDDQLPTPASMKVHPGIFCQPRCYLEYLLTMFALEECWQGPDAIVGFNALRPSCSSSSVCVRRLGDERSKQRALFNKERIELGKQKQLNISVRFPMKILNKGI